MQCFSIKTQKSVNYLFESYIAAANICIINIGYHKLLILEKISVAGYFLF